VMLRRLINIRDWVLLSAITLVACFLLFEYDLFREEGTPAAQGIDLNELLLVGASLAVGLLVAMWHQRWEHKKEQAKRIAAEETAHRAARHDSLTGLPNRLLFTERTGEALGRVWKQGCRCAVLFIDLDGFKPVNDQYGHAAGDALLIEIAERLQQRVPAGSSVGRLGGDEFAVMIEIGDGEDASALAERRILREIQRPFAINGKTVTVGATIGVAIGPESGRRAEDLIHAADLAMYEGKHAGRGTVRVFKAARGAA
jgi:diguanylate cyclase (GGDEF)-like protein